MSAPFVFISYFREDTSAVRDVLNAFDAAGIAYWFDDKGMEIGEQWERKIERKINDASAFVAFLSEQYVKRPQSYVHKELQIAGAKASRLDASVRWFLPVCLGAFPLPDMPLGPARSVASVHAMRIDGRQDAIDALVQQVRDITRQPELNLTSIRLTTAKISSNPMVLFGQSGFDIESLKEALLPHKKIAIPGDVKVLGADGGLAEFSEYWREYTEQVPAKWSPLPRVRVLKSHATLSFSAPPGQGTLQVCHAEWNYDRYGAPIGGTSASLSVWASDPIQIKLATRESATLQVQDTPRTGFMWSNRPTERGYYLQRTDI